MAGPLGRFTVTCVHLDPNHANGRTQEIRKLGLALGAGHQSRPRIMLGDFNFVTHSEDRWTIPEEDGPAVASGPDQVEVTAFDKAMPFFYEITGPGVNTFKCPRFISRLDRVLVDVLPTEMLLGKWTPWYGPWPTGKADHRPVGMKYSKILAPQLFPSFPDWVVGHPRFPEYVQEELEVEVADRLTRAGQDTGPDHLCCVELDS